MQNNAEPIKMKPLKDLNLGFNDAENYKRKDEKELFNRVFLKTDALEKLRNPSTFFLIGEKGTGKTAHAMYLVNNADENIKYSINFLRDAGYEKFVALKKQNNLQLSDYSDIWKPILFLLLSEMVRKNEANLFTRYLKFRATLRNDCAELLENEKYYIDAIRRASVVLEQRLNEAVGTGAKERQYGASLVRYALAKDTGKLVISEFPNEQDGVFQLFSGAIAFVRNPPAHKKVQYTELEAWQTISLIDYLLLLLRQAKLRET